MELVVSLALFILALVPRLIYLMDSPRFIDEGVEALWALDIARGRHLPLTGVSAYLGPLSSYLLAGLLRLFGAHVELPRLMVAVFGALTVVVAYHLGRVMGGRLTGLIAAALTLTSPHLVVYISRYAFSNSLTPFFATVTLLTLYSGVTRGRSGLVALSGLLAGLTMLTHPTAAFLVLGALIWYARWGASPARNRRRETALGGALCVGALLPLLLSLLAPGSPLLRDALARPYVVDMAPSLARLLLRPFEFVKSFFYMVGGVLEPETPDMRLTQVLMALALGGGVWLNARRGQRLGPVVLLTTAVGFTLALSAYYNRYLAYLLPISYIMIGMFLVEMGRRVSHVKGRLALVVGVMVWLVAYPVVHIGRFLRYEAATGGTNAEHFRLREVTLGSGACGSSLLIEGFSENAVGPVEIEREFSLVNTQFMLTYVGCEHQTASLSEIRRRLAAGFHGWLILTERDRALPGQFGLVPQATFHPPPNLDGVAPLTLYRTD